MSCCELGSTYDRAALVRELDDVADLDVQTDVSLRDRTSMKVGGLADVVASPRTVASLCALLSLCGQQDVPFVVLGGGSNVVVSDAGVRGVVVHPRVDFRRQIGDGIWRVGAGAGLGGLVRWSVDAGLQGLDVLAGIPGSVGGALVMNAGGQDGEIGAAVKRVQVVEVGGARWLDADLCGFGYRRSGFPAGAVISQAEFELQAAVSGDADGENRAASEALRSRVRAAQSRRRSSQPLSQPSAGSVFKNPEGDFAGRLLELAGCKGLSVGGALVSQAHANFIVNTGSATGGDVFRLAQDMRARVLRHAGLELAFEIRFVGDFGADFRKASKVSKV